jgi:hypothetical protein
MGVLKLTILKSSILIEATPIDWALPMGVGEGRAADEAATFGTFARLPQPTRH